MTEDFNKWWDSDELDEDNPYELESALFWAWEGWRAALKVKHKPLMTDEEYEQAMVDEGQRRMLEFDADVRAMIKEAVDAEREACASLCFQMWDEWMDEGDKSEFSRPDAEDCARAIRARGNHD